MALFDFVGIDVTTTGAGYGSSTTHVNTTITEGTLQFTFSSTATVDHILGGLDVAGSSGAAWFASGFASPGTITISNIDTNGKQVFFSNPNIQFSSVFLSSQATGGKVSVIFSNTVVPNTSKVTFGNAASSFQFVGTAGNPYTTAAATGEFNKIKIIYSKSTTLAHGFNATPSCFMPGTRIATAEGETAVEDLRPGDRIRTAKGTLTTVKWIGEQQIDPRLMHPARINPICIRAGALGDGVPQRDLYVSADHAVELDGALYDAGALVNGRSIYQLQKIPLEPFTYYHVETEAHELLLAEGCAAESFIDYAARDEFDNADETPDAGHIAEMDLPRISAARAVPQSVVAYLSERADAISRRAA